MLRNNIKLIEVGAKFYLMLLRIWRLITIETLKLSWWKGYIKIICYKIMKLSVNIYNIIRQNWVVQWTVIYVMASDWFVRHILSNMFPVRTQQ